MILIVCDHKKRELEIQEKLKRKFIEKNIPCKIINKHTILKCYNYFKPKIIIFPHANGYLSKVIDKLGNKVIKILVPTEHCAFIDKFIEIQYLGNYDYNQNSLKSIDYIFCQSEHTKKILTDKFFIEKDKVLISGHAYYSEWKYGVKKKGKVKNIGIALTNEFIMRKFKSGNLMKDFYKLNNDTNLSEHEWRFGQISFDLYLFSLIFKIIKNLKKYNVSIRTHTVDVESDFKFLENENLSIDNNSRLDTWMSKQDLIISCISFINVDTYIRKIPHISLIEMVPDQFFFKAYNLYTYKEFIEPNSYKPKNLDELLYLIKDIDFKENSIMDEYIKKYFSFPYKTNPLDLISNSIHEKFQSLSIEKFEPILSDNDKKIINIFGKKIGFFISLFLSQIKISFNKNSRNSYFDFKFFMK